MVTCEMRRMPCVLKDLARMPNDFAITVNILASLSKDWLQFSLLLRLPLYMSVSSPNTTYSHNFVRVPTTVLNVLVRAGHLAMRSMDKKFEDCPFALLGRI